MGYPSVLTAPRYGFYDALFRGRAFKVQRPFGHHVVENVTFKFVPAGNHAQSAIEAAFRLHPHVKDRLDDIESVTIRSQQPLMRIMDKRGPLTNPADRDHCAQYVVAVGLILGSLEASCFEDAFAADPRIDTLRAKMTVIEDPRYTRDHLDPEKRSKANAIEVRLKGGTTLPTVEVEYPIGHPRRRAECLPMLEQKLEKHLRGRFPAKQARALLDLCLDQHRLEATAVHEFMDAMVI
jgi:2-methylcitrate dehydratase PrpD